MPSLGIPLFFGFALAAALVAALNGGALAWDGAYYLFKALDDQVPFTPLGRQINVLLQVPLLAASGAGVTDLGVLRRLFAVPYALVPVVGLALSWLLVRRRQPALFVWPALFVGLALLPGLFFYTSEGPMIGALFWPVLLAILVGTGRPGALAVGVLALLLWLTHPLFIVFATFAGLVALFSAWRDVARRRVLVATGASLLLLACLKLLAPLSGYETESLSLQRLRDAYQAAVRGWPAASLAFTAGAAMLTLAEPWANGRLPGWAARAVRYAPMPLALAAGMVLVPWARDPYRWAHALDFRFWVGPLALTFMAAAAFEHFQARARIEALAVWRARAVTLVAVGASMLLIVGLQARAWGQQVALLNTFTAAQTEACIPLHSIPWIAGNPMDHWGTTSLSLVLQGVSPVKVVVEVPSACDELAAGRGVRLGSWETRPFGTGRWFELEGLRLTG